MARRTPAANMCSSQTRVLCATLPTCLPLFSPSPTTSAAWTKADGSRSRLKRVAGQCALLPLCFRATTFQLLDPALPLQHHEDFFPMRPPETCATGREHAAGTPCNWAGGAVWQLQRHDSRCCQCKDEAASARTGPQAQGQEYTGRACRPVFLCSAAQ